MQVVRAAHQGVIKNLLTINHMAWSRLEQRPMVRINGRRLHILDAQEAGEAVRVLQAVAIAPSGTRGTETK